MSKRKRATGRSGDYPEYATLSLDQLYGERRSLGLQMQAIGVQYRELRLRSEHLTARIRALRDGDSGIGISDHAVLRYLERVKGMDLNAIRDEIRAHAALRSVADVPDQIAVGADVSFAIYDGHRIATVWPTPPATQG